VLDEAIVHIAVVVNCVASDGEMGDELESIGKDAVVVYWRLDWNREPPDFESGTSPPDHHVRCCGYIIIARSVCSFFSCLSYQPFGCCVSTYSYIK
jgi:hypothetical protein